MEYTFYELAGFYFIYSFIGWCLEVCIAAIRKREFINRGFVSGPLCPIYGAGAAAFAVFLPDLRENPFFLFLGGVILASFLEFITGRLLEKIFHKKWWDYSDIRFNFEGFICLRYSLLWGILAVLLVYIVNPLMASLLHLIPAFIGVVSLWALAALLLFDTIGTSLAILGMQKKMERLSPLTDGMTQVSGILENAITRRIQNRMKKAFPVLESGELTAKQKERAAVFAEGCGFYKLLSLFFIGAFLGDITETVFCLFTTGRLMSRSSVIYGPFSIVWGIGCMLLTAILYRIKDKSDSYIFAAGTILGGAYEYVCSVFTELVFGTIFWDYSGFAFNLGGRINLLYCFFWGIAAVVWMKWIYPLLSRFIEKLPVRAGKIGCNIMLVFMILNCLISALALARYTERNTLSGQQESAQETVGGQEASAESSFVRFLDTHYPDARMEHIYPNAKIVENMDTEIMN